MVRYISINVQEWSEFDEGDVDVIRSFFEKMGKNLERDGYEHELREYQAVDIPCDDCAIGADHMIDEQIVFVASIPKEDKQWRNSFKNLIEDFMTEHGFSVRFWGYNPEHEYDIEVGVEITPRGSRPLYFKTLYTGLAQDFSCEELREKLFEKEEEK